MASRNASLLELPSELKLQIFLHIPAREIARLRSVCPTFRDLVDSHSEQISKEINARELVRLRDFISYYVTYEGDVSFLEAFSRWARLRGWAPSNTGLSHTANTDSNKAFSKHWVSVKRYPDLSEQTQMTIARLADLLFKISIALPRLTTDDRMYHYQYLRSMQMLRGNVPGFSDEECTAMYNELRDHPGKRLAGPRRSIQRIVSGEIAFADPIHAPGAEPSKLVRTIHPVGYERSITSKQATDIFCLPKLPWTNHFTYCFESDWAYDTISEIIRLHTQKQRIPPLMFASGMEELRIW